MAKLVNGIKVQAPALSGGGSTLATYIRQERKVSGGRWVTFDVVRYRAGGAEFRYAKGIVKAAPVRKTR
jgi:hypothetical protein